MRVRLTLDPDDRVVLESPYDQAFVQALKQALPWGGRAWDPQRKRWLISALYAQALTQFLESYGIDIQDDRPGQGVLVAVPPMPEELRLAFDVLYLNYTAPLCVANASFRALSQFYHPDRGGNPEMFHRINDAIAVIRFHLDPPQPEEQSHGH